MEKTYAMITIATLLLLLTSTTLAHGQQQDLFPFSFPTLSTTTTKNQTSINNNMHDHDMGSHSFSDYRKKAENINANVNYDSGHEYNSNNAIANDSSSGNNNNNNNSYVPKAVILNFYDNDIGQFTNAKPILDKYGFKGTFFIVCRWADSDSPDRMNWGQITQLYREGHDIESHSTSHKVLTSLSDSDLVYQVGQSKQCLHEHLGVYPTVFSPPHNKGWNNETAIKSIAKYYDLSIGGFVSDLMFLHCHGWKQDQQRTLTQTDCRTYSNNNDDGTLNYANRYDIKEVSHNGLDTDYSHDDTKIFKKFIQLVNNQANFNKDGKINAIPIIGYHNIEDDKAITSTDVNLFDAEMKYLHDNGFKVLTMSDLGYDENSNYLYVKK
jgi:peptidoglycan/xylan/chitin deacetylase (PgdA/CDA1 family)